MLQVNFPSDEILSYETHKLRMGGRVHIGDVEIHPTKAAGFIASYQKCMHETVFSITTLYLLDWFGIYWRKKNG